MVNNCSGDGLSPIPRQAMTWTNDDLLLIWPFRTTIGEIFIKTQKFAF